VIGVLTRLEHEDPLGCGVDANLIPDSALGVTAVCLSTDDPFLDIEDVSLTLYSACLVSELLEQSARPLPESGQANSHPTKTKESNQ